MLTHTLSTHYSVTIQIFSAHTSQQLQQQNGGTRTLASVCACVLSIQLGIEWVCGPLWMIKITLFFILSDPEYSADCSVDPGRAFKEHTAEWRALGVDWSKHKHNRRLETGFSCSTCHTGTSAEVMVWNGTNGTRKCSWPWQAIWSRSLAKHGRSEINCKCRCESGF